MTLITLLWELLRYAFVPREERWRLLHTAWQIDCYTFFSGQFADVLLRFTWELPQSLAGYATAHVLNITQSVSRITYFEAALVMGASFSGGSFSLGQYVFMSDGGAAGWADHLFVHEYGHSRQSRRLGPLYLFIIAIPSLLSFYIDGLRYLGYHNLRWYETWANRLGAAYADETFGKGAAGYTPHNSGYFDVHSFWGTGHLSSYINPRNKLNNAYGHEYSTQWHWTDIFLQLIGLVVLTLVCWLFAH